MLIRLFSVLLLSILIIAGCTRPTEQQAEVSGKVTYKGKPLPGGRVTFVGSKGYVGDGKISPQGEYSIKSPLGEVQIGVDNTMLKPDPNWEKYQKMQRLKKQKDFAGQAENPPTDSTQAPPLRGGITGTYVPLPKRYADPTSSGLNFTVEPGSQTHDIELTDDSSAKPGS